MARKLFALSAMKGNRVAAFKLGEMYENGSGIAVDLA
jgi:TPR repeat protein